MIPMKRTWLPLFASFLLLSFMTQAQSVEYAVDGLKLGQKVTGAGVQSYNCQPSDEFTQLVSCERTQTRNRGYDYSALSTVMHDESGIAILLGIKVTPVRMTKSEAQKEIDQLSKELGGKPLSVDVFLYFAV